MDLTDQLLQVWDFISKWAYLPASAVILLITGVIKRTFASLGKLNFIWAMLLGMIFAWGQMVLAVPLGYAPLQTEWIPAVFMGFCTGFVAIEFHTIGKNGWQAFNGGKK